MAELRIVIVMLRQPRLKVQNEMRTDPLWEFGSFGCTRCHRKNLMNPKKLTEHNGARFAFAQNGELGIKLVYVTPPVRMLHHGLIGFVGLMMPHLVRLVLGGDNARVLPGSALAGAVFLIWAAAAARVVMAPEDMPIGVVTGLIGGVFFIWMMAKRR